MPRTVNGTDQFGDWRTRLGNLDERFAELGFDDVKSESKDSDSDDLLDLMDSIK